MWSERGRFAGNVEGEGVREPRRHAEPQLRAISLAFPEGDREQLPTRIARPMVTC